LRGEASPFWIILLLVLADLETGHKPTFPALISVQLFNYSLRLSATTPCDNCCD
jgi:hypothetical protein